MADEDKLVKAGVEAALKPFADLLEKLAGPAAEEIGLTLKDHVRVFRLKRQIRLFERVRAMLAESGVSAKRVPLKLLEPIIEAASVEEDDTLQDKWAALLTNCAINSYSVHPSFIEILRELSVVDVVFLDVIYDRSKRSRKRNDKTLYSEIAQRLRDNAKRQKVRFVAFKLTRAVVESNLIRLGLVENVASELEYPRYTLTNFGHHFVSACKAKEKEKPTNP